MSPTFFADQAAFRSWLLAHHETETELLVGFYKVGTGKPSLTWPESVDQALCFGWIDGIRRTIDAESYSIRFTPRKPRSIWSAVNIAKVEELSQKGLMYPAGMAAFAKRDDSRSGIYSHEQKEVRFSEPFEQPFRANATAWSFFWGQAPSYRKAAINWVMSAKQPQTQWKRLEELIKDSEQQQRVKPFRYERKA